MNNKMKRKVLILTGVIVVATVIFLALKPFEKKSDAFTFDTVKVERGTIANTVTATGTIEAIKTVNVGTQVSGIIQHVYVDFNKNVKQGEVLARLDETPLKAQLEQSQASVDQAQAQLNFQEATYNRLKPLFDKNLIAKADFDQAVYNYQNSKAALSNARSALARAKINLEYATILSPIDGVVLNRAVEEGQTVAASFNTPTLFTIVNDLTQMEVQTSVDEADIGKVKEGQRVEFTVDAYPDLKFVGSVSQVRLQPVTTNNVVTYVVILNAPNPDKKLMPGMTASTTIYVEEKENTMILSGKAVRFTPDKTWLMKMAQKKGFGQGKSIQGAPSTGMYGSGSNSQITAGEGGFQQTGKTQGSRESSPNSKRVWIKTENGLIRPARITTGVDNGTNIEVTSGLKEGEEVVIAMSTGTKNDTSVKTTTIRPRGPFPF
jgi:HlyD family secretion protein